MRSRSGVVIGGGSGIGKATSKLLAGAGHRIVVADKSRESAEGVAADLSAAGGEVWATACDASRLTDVEQSAEFATQTIGPLGFAVVSIGITQSGGIMESDPDRWEPLLETNLLGVANCLRAYLPLLERADGGQAVVIASLSGRETYAGQPLYIASKWGAVGLVHSVRKEAQARGVRVTLIEPGLVDTPMSRSNPHAQKVFEKVNPLTADDVARAVAYVLDQPRNVLVRELALQPLEQDI